MRPIVGLWLFSLTLSGCTGEQAEVDEVRELNAALTATELSVLGFEDVSQWSVVTGPATIANSTTLKSEGAKSLQMSGMQYASIRNSVAITKDGTPAPSVVGFDLRVPINQPNPNWHGAVELYVNAPSVSVYNQYLGNVQLQNVPKGTFERMTFTVPETVRTALNSGNYNDLRFTIALNVPAGSLAHYFDKFTLGPETCTPVSDNNVCTTDTCNPATGTTTYTPVASGTACSDGNACNGAETCDGSGTCQAGTPPELDDGNPCTEDACTPEGGVTHTPVTAGTSCSDDDVCNGEEVCDAAGACQAGAPLEIDDENPCTLDTCTPEGGVAHEPLLEGTPCSDGDACNGEETCDAAAECQEGTPPTIDDGNPCTIDSCDAETGVRHVPAAAGTSCDDGLLCNGSEACDGEGTCRVAVPLVIDDGNPCTLDACSEVTGAVHTPLQAGMACEDDNVCNGTEVCDGVGACVAGTPLNVVSDENPCVASVTCDPVSGINQVFEPIGTVCGPGFICDGAGQCLRDQGGGTLPLPLPPGGASGIRDYGSSLPREPVPGCALETIKRESVALIVGTVTTFDAVSGTLVPVPNARVTIPRRCEFGAVWTSVDGSFRLPVNGGETVTVRVEADADGDGVFDYLPAERPVETKWGRTAGAMPIELILPAAPSEPIALTDGVVPGDVMVHGPVNTDDRDGDGVPAPRTPSVLLKAGTLITGVDEHGDSVELDEAQLRITEYTVGPSGLLRMPAPLPPGTEYGYAAELSIDGLDEAYFDPPAVFYLDNFLGAEASRSGEESPHVVGLPVPTWYYDRSQGAWFREKDGIIIRLVGVTEGTPSLALIDADNDGDSDQDDEIYLAERDFEIDPFEREQLALDIAAGRRSIDDELWRVEREHFSPIDLNWLSSFCLLGSCLPGAVLQQPNLNKVTGSETCKPGSQVNVETMSLTEHVDVGGTPYRLTYSSRSVLGYWPKRQRFVSLAFPGPRPPYYVGFVPSLTVGGSMMIPCMGLFLDYPSCGDYLSTPDSVLWDGRDWEGRIAYGTHRGYWLPLHNFRRKLTSIWVGRPHPLEMTVYDAKLHGLGGWTLSSHHFLDVDGPTLFKGDGNEVRQLGTTITQIRSLPEVRSAADVYAVETTRDGGAFLSAGGGVYRYDPSGAVTKWSDLSAQVIAEDGPTKVYLADYGAVPSRIRRLELIEGTIQETANISRANAIVALTLGDDGLIYALQNSIPISIHRFSRDLTHVDGEAPYVTFPGNPNHFATSGIAVREGTLYAAVGPAAGIFRYRPDDPDGVVRIANSGGGSSGTGLVEGELATSFPGTVGNTLFQSLKVDDAGVLFGLRYEGIVWRIDDEGRLRRVAGNKDALPGAGNGGPALEAGLGWSYAFDVAPDDALLVYTQMPLPALHRVQSASGSLVTGDISVPSENGREIYDFDQQGRHLRTRNAFTNDVLLSFEYENGLLSAMVEGDNRGPDAESLPRTRVHRNVGGEVSIEAPSGQITRILVKPDGYASTIIDAAGRTLSLLHDSQGLLRMMRDQRGFLHTFGYDDLGRLISDTTPGLVPQTLAGTHLRQVIHTNGEGEQSTYEVSVSRSGHTRNLTQTDGATATISIDPLMTRNTTKSDGTVVREQFARHPQFNLTSPLLASRTTSLPSGRTRRETHQISVDNHIWTETYGLNGRTSLVQTDGLLKTVTATSAQGRTVMTLLDDKARPVWRQMGDLEPISYTYDSHGRVTTVSRGTGATERIALMSYYPDGTGLPEAGYLMSLTTPTDETLTFTRDAFGRPLSVSLAEDTVQFGYSYAGDLEQLTTPNEDPHIQLFNGARLMTDYLAPAVDGVESVTEFSYDQARRPTTTTLPGGVNVTSSRDGADPEHPTRKGRLRTMTSPSNGGGTAPFVVSYTYADEVECPEPDPEEEEPEPCPIGPAGQLSTLSRGGLTTTLVWDGFVPVGETLSAAPQSGLVGTSYGITLNADLKAQAEQVTVGESELLASFGYDNDSVLMCAAQGPGCSSASGVVYGFDSGSGDMAPSGHGLLESTVSGQVQEAFTYNAFGELATHEVSESGTPLWSVTYSDEEHPRDKLGRIVTLQKIRDDITTTTEYGYDAKGQLVTVTPSEGIPQTYRYDANGNRLCMFEAPAAECEEEAVYDAQDRLRSYEGVDYSYTDRGTLFQRDDGETLETFTYDALGNLTQIERNTGSTISYVIDAQGRRVGKKVGGSVDKQYIWSSQLRIAAELNGSGEVVSRFIYSHSPNSPALVVRRTPNQSDRVYRVITDHLGSPVYIVNIANASDVWLDASYDAWGNVTSFKLDSVDQGTDTTAWPIPHGFAGGLFDSDTGLVRFGARDYDPRIGRWTAKDPILFEGGQANLYVYVGNEPVQITDPTGHFAPLLILGSAALLSGVAGYVGSDGNIAVALTSATAGLLGGVGLVAGSGGLVLGTIGTVATATVATDGFKNLSALFGVGGSLAGGAFCGAVTGPAGFFACPFAAEAAGKAAESALEDKECK